MEPVSSISILDWWKFALICLLLYEFLLLWVRMPSFSLLTMSRQPGLFSFHLHSTPYKSWILFSITILRQVSILTVSVPICQHGGVPYILSLARSVFGSVWKSIKMSPAIKLYTYATPNGHKVSVLLEFLNVPYEAVLVDIKTGLQKLDWFLKINPDGKIPALTDSLTGITVSQSSAIVQYLVDTYDTDHKFSPVPGTPEIVLSNELIFLEASEFASALTQAIHFSFWCTESIPFAKEKFVNEMKRLLSVYEKYLERNQANGLYFVSDHYTIVDFGLATWVGVFSAFNIKLEEWPLLSQWFSALSKIPQFDKGISVPFKLRLEL